MLKLRLMVVALAIIALTVGSLTGGALAEISRCNADVQNDNPPVPSDTGFDFLLSFTGSDQVQWVKVTRPNSNLNFYDASSDWWPSVSFDDATASFTGASYDSNTAFSLHVVAHLSEWAPTSNWDIEVSSDPNGANPVQCDGTLGLTESETAFPTISGITAQLLLQSATLVWVTDKPTVSTVDYGLTSNYGSTQQDNDYTTQHQMNITGLAAGKGYHYQITAQDRAGNSVNSGDNTFLVPDASVFTNLGGSSSGATPSITTKPTEIEPPKVTVDTQLKPVYKVVPTVSGSATDNVAVAKLEYSLDGGKNWLVADIVSGLGTPSVKFSFTPTQLLDGSYKMLVRATDSSGNTAVSPAQTLVIDLLPPQVGPAVISVGPQILNPEADGVTRTQAGTDQTISVNAIGGATSVTVGLARGKSQTEAAQFSLTQEQNGLWSGLVSVPQAGNYRLIAHAVDGANNHTTQIVGALYAAAPSMVTNANHKPVKGAKVYLYSQQADTHTWQLWDAAALGQQNPQTTSKNALFHFYVPAGSYYLKVVAKGYSQLYSNTISVDSAQTLNASVNLQRSATLDSIKGGSSVLPWNYSAGSLQVSPHLALSKSRLLSSGQLANFNLPLSSGGKLRTADLFGKPTVLSFMTSWAPSSSAQLASLQALARNPDINVVPVFEQENADQIRSFLTTAGINLPAIADENGELLKTYPITTLPTSFVVNRHGEIKAVQAGTLTEKALLNAIGGL